MQRSLAIAALLTTLATSLPAHHWPGHTLSGDGFSRITIDVFGDFQCPYTAKVWPTLTHELPQLMNTSTLRVRYHLFEVVSHHNAYDAAKAAYVTSSPPNASFPAVAQALFDAQAAFSNAATANITRLEVAGILYDLTGAGYGIPRGLWMERFDSDETASAVSAEHTYAISKGIHGTPTFWVQDTYVPEADSSWNGTMWRQYLSQL
eukprot:TRINITY_DN6532_c0_g1_i1.p1 TRINITY_DN6532_c0_g1~~TRINITY_DN6532_c0_g1_i1.p1  ORF type:complete len:206 (+),score=34.56 TRINITY_DN6532_c0_g1_i1:146-763(+)